ncbi:hypothetical protein Y032_0013g1925 [Ancylostoma ceylanicum]|nr:hypothetical protein Y032_0013g1925 [Ancylostoma ceylanicum]
MTRARTYERIEMVLLDKVPVAHYITNIWQRDVVWEKHNPAYRTLLGHVHVVNAAKVLLLLEMIVILIYLLFLFPYWIFWIGMHLVIILLTLYALKKEKHRWMWPINILVAFQFAVWSLVTVFELIIGMFDPNGYLQFYGQSHHEELPYKVIITCIVRAVVILITAALFWRLSVFHTTRRYLKAKANGAPKLHFKAKADGGGDEASGVEKLITPT